MSQRFSSDVLIIGGGAAGLAAALQLAEHARVTVLAKGDMEISEETLATVLDVEKAPRTSKAPVGDLLGMAERELILRALEETGGNKTEACQKLGISRRTLYRRLEKHGLLQEENGES